MHDDTLNGSKVKKNTSLSTAILRCISPFISYKDKDVQPGGSGSSASFDRIVWMVESTLLSVSYAAIIFTSALFIDHYIHVCSPTLAIMTYYVFYLYI